ncbi:MAG: T9SS type A sorting domain-containing protein [Bacteroidales bacterium]
MKKILLITLVLGVGISSLFAQKNMGIIPAHLKNQTAIRMQGAVDLPISPIAVENPYVAPQPNKVAHKVTGNSISKTQNALAVSETIIGTTRYDLQTNTSVQNRLFVHPDGTIGATFTYGQLDAAFSDRGTGYNYFDGATWGAQPTARIETVRNGWPSYCPLGAGELVVSHNGSTGLQITSRATKGTGTWAESVLVGPTTSGGTTALLWPRAITSGNTIHIIACTDQAVSPAVYTYEGLQLALVYIRSTDGGTSWDAPLILPGMDSATVVDFNNKGFGGDGYAWALPKGDTIAFVVGEWWADFFIMKSTDGGDTWSKITVFDFPTPAAAPTPIMATVDGSVAIALDDNGKANVVVGRMRVSDDDYADDTYSWYPYTDGLLYWKEGMPQWDTTLLNDDAALFAAGNLIGYMLDWNGSDTIEFPAVGTDQFPFGNYQLSLSSMPQIAIDGNNVYVTYSSCMETKTLSGANPNEQLYRHIMFTKSNDGGITWDTVTVDLNSDIVHDYDECVFGSLAVQDKNLYVIYQADAEPGLAVRGDEDPYSTNNIYYMRWKEPSTPYDAGIKTIISPVVMTNIGVPVTVSAIIKNFGDSSLTSIPVDYIVNGGTPVTETWTGILTAGNSANYTFTTTYLPPSMSSYQLCVKTTLPNDTVTSNDQKCGLYYTSVAIDAGITKIILPTGPMTFIDTAQTVSATIKNFGDSSLTSIPVVYIVTGGAPVTETWTGLLAHGDSIDYTFTATYLPPSMPSYQLCVKTAIQNEINYINDQKCNLYNTDVGIEEVTNNGIYIGQNYPNPSSNYSYVDLTLSQTQNVDLIVTNMMGQQVFSHAYGNLSVGNYTLIVESGKFSSGVYFYTVKAGNNTVTNKMIVE